MQLYQIVFVIENGTLSSHDKKVHDSAYDLAHEDHDLSSRSRIPHPLLQVGNLLVWQVSQNHISNLNIKNEKLLTETIENGDDVHMSPGGSQSYCKELAASWTYL